MCLCGLFSNLTNREVIRLSNIAVLLFHDTAVKEVTYKEENTAPDSLSANLCFKPLKVGGFLLNMFAK